MSFAIFVDTIEIYKVMFNYFAVEYFAVEERVVPEVNVLSLLNLEYLKPDVIG